MASKTGGVVSFSFSTPFGTLTGSQHAIINYSVSSSATTTTLTISSIQIKIDSLSAGGSALGLNGTLSATGYSNSSYSGEPICYAGTVYTFASNVTRSWSRTTSAQTKTVSLASNVSTLYGTSGNSTASISVTVPALESWSVTYDANGGTGAPASQLKYYNTTLTLSSQKPVKDDYTFRGWATTLAHAAAGTVDYASGASYTTNGVLELFAVWELTYQKPTVDNLSAERCNSDGSANDEGSYAKVSFDWSVFTSSASQYYGGSGAPYSSNGATCSVTVGSVTVTPTLTGSSGHASAVVGNAFDVDTQYSISVSVTDTQSIVSSPDNTTTVAGILATSKFPMDFNADATAVGFFMPAPDNTSGMYLHGDLYLDLSDYNDPTTVDGQLYDAIVALGWQNDVLVN